MKPETKIDYEKIIKQNYAPNSYYAREAVEMRGIILLTELQVYSCIKQGITEAIRLAAPLFAKQARTKNRKHDNDASGQFDIQVVDQQSIIDAVESITKQIVGELKT